MEKYQIIYADPPWSYSSVICPTTMKRFNNVSEHYDTMSTEEIIKIPVQNIADKNCLLFIWVTSPLLPDGIDVLEGWGFEYGTVAFCWDKILPLLGAYTMSEIELCLVGKRGNIPKPRGIRNAKQFYAGEKLKHSQKPYEIRNRINKMFPTQKKIELFARKEPELFESRFEGWDVWGNEVESDIKLR